MKTIVVLFTILGVLSLSGCSGQPVEQAKNDKVSTEQTPHPDKEVLVDTSAVRAQQVAMVNAAFAEVPPTPEWESKVRGGSVFRSIQSGYARLASMEQAFALIGERHVSWEEVLVSPDEARNRFRNLAQQVTRQLLLSFDFSYESRERAGSISGEIEAVTFCYTDGVMDEVVRIMKSCGLEPKDIGHTYTAMRQALLNGFRAELGDTRAKIAAGYDFGEAGGERVLLQAIKTAMDKWSFTQAELRLNNQEVELLKKSRIRRG